jgi:hypothetical protein
MAAGVGGFSDSQYFKASKASDLGGAAFFDSTKIEIFNYEVRSSPSWSFEFGYLSGLGWGGNTALDPTHQVSLNNGRFTWRYFPNPVVEQKIWGKELYLGGGVDFCKVTERRGGIEKSQDTAGAILLVGGELYLGKSFGVISEAKVELIPAVSTSLGDFNPSNYSIVVGLRYHFQ